MEINELCDIVRETSFAIHKYHRNGHLEKIYEGRHQESLPDSDHAQGSHNRYQWYALFQHLFPEGPEDAGLELDIGVQEEQQSCIDVLQALFKGPEFAAPAWGKRFP